MSVAFSLDFPTVSSMTGLDLESTGGQDMTVIGADFGLVGFSSHCNCAGSSAFASVWNSETSVTCKFASGIGWSHMFSLTVNSLVASSSFALSYYSSSVTDVFPSNMVASGLASITSSGAAFGITVYCIVGRFGSTNAAASNWISDTSTLCQSAAGVGSAVSLSVTAGGVFGTFFSAISYNLPSITSGASSAQSRSILGSWCAYDGDLCSCQGIVGFVGEDGSFTGSGEDSSSSVICAANMCYCFNLPFTGGQTITVIGEDFGTADYTPSSTVSSTSAEFTQWFSQSAIICSLPKCTDCLFTSTSESIVVAVASQSSPASDITDSYTFVNGTTRRRALQLVEVVHKIEIPYLFTFLPSQRCPHFWQKEAMNIISLETGMLCRLEYSTNENMIWTIDPCSSSNDCSVLRKNGPSVCSLLQTHLTFTLFGIGVGDVLAVSSCESLSCSSRLATVQLSGSVYPSPVVGGPHLKLQWTSDNHNDVLIGWIITWRTEFSRLFQVFSHRMVWQEAAAFCKALSDSEDSWSLASIRSAREQSAAEELASSLGQLLPIWIGLKDVESGGVYVWADNSSLVLDSYTNWSPYESDNLGAIQRSKADCTALVYSASGWMWKTQSCEAELSFICSKG